ncbi:MAG: gamma carbonic anhydrase family protein [Candidatus Nitrohelix vancouverensis]|uniref:Gamma carbonic anhydrase family protein n=1 Tax=Candidatus Nitrohelix vancouverensis TaxID=2705534 RepID=A0A7T0C1R9_9BACT|nr:MAG: gamma carbonic anhydrase family protein [Candidatus Nitrohelix vancouverensis]
MIHTYKDKTPILHPSVFLADGACVIGDVEMQEWSSVWFNAVVRGDVHYIRIGKRTNIQDGCVLHVSRGKYPLILGDDITVGHNVTLHACTIKDRCLIGMGAVVMDGAVVGEDAIVGAGSLVTARTVIPPRTMAIGSPAKVKRELTDEEVLSIRESAEHYVGDVRDYRPEY